MAAEAVDTFCFVADTGGAVWTFKINYMWRADLFAAAAHSAFLGIKMRGFGEVLFGN